MDYLIFEVLTLCKINKNDQQIRAILKTLSVSQIDKIQKFVKSILNGKITLNDTLYRQLSKHKNFLRVICIKFNVNYILKNYDAFCEIMKIMLKNYNNELRKKSSSDTLRGMEQSRRTEYKKQRSDNIEEKSGIKFKEHRRKGNIGEKNVSERNQRKEKDEYETTSENEVESETEYEETDSESESEINKIENSNEEEEE